MFFIKDTPIIFLLPIIYNKIDDLLEMAENLALSKLAAVFQNMSEKQSKVVTH